MTTGDRPPAGVKRWITYQRERFPVIGHGVLILAFSSGAVTFSALLRAQASGQRLTVATISVVVAFLSSFFFFFQLRVSDEFKDFDEDARWRPYRPVPRGLVTLGELRTLAIAGMVVQLALAVVAAPRLVGLLLLVWLYMGLMTTEFWAHDFLQAHPFTTLWTHMLIMPFIDLYATACDWMIAGEARAVGSGLGWFLVASFFNGMVVEVGRKIRAPADEEEGVVTYSRVWGRRRAILFWILVMLLTTGAAVLAASHTGGTRVVAVGLGVMLLVGASLGLQLAVGPVPGRGKRLEVLSGLWTIVLYLSLGVVPFLLETWRG